MATIGMQQFSYRPQDPKSRYKGVILVIALHALILWALATGLARDTQKLIKKTLEAAVIQEVFIPPPPPPPPKEIKPPEPQNAPKIDTPPPPAFVPPPDVPVNQSTTAPAIQSTQQVPTAPPVIAPPPPPPAPDNSKAVIASMEAEYFAGVRAMLEATKRYPTGRRASQERPQGKTVIWFTLSRNGTLVDSGVLQSSDSNLLDDAALSTVRRGSYKPFPPNTWSGYEQYKFKIEIEFHPPSS